MRPGTGSILATQGVRTVSCVLWRASQILHVQACNDSCEHSVLQI